MAILIPSKNIYDKQNPKVRDNVIERIEVNAIEVLPNNEYETPVYNEEIYSTPSAVDTNKTEYKVYSKADNSGSINGYWIAFSKISSIKYYKINFDIPRVFNNKYINQLYVGVDKDENPQIKYTIYYKKTSYSSSMSATFYQNDQVLTTYGTISKNEKKTTDGNSSNFDFVRIYEYSYNPDIGVWGNTTTNKVLLSLQKSPNISNIREENILDTSDENYYKISNLMILGEYEQSLLGGWDYGSIGYPENKTITLQGDTTKYTAQKIEITVYGDTIGIDLTDKTVYINGETAKKVHSVDGNELMQTSNYYKNSGRNAITNAFSKTKTAYALGKETATIRCSISDYYDYDSGDKMISIDNSTRKMSFKMYDQVIPMVYGADRQDRPMSTYQDGSPKVFQVLGSNIYYDGAVWQELSLQEVDKSQIL